MMLPFQNRYDLSFEVYPRADQNEAKPILGRDINNS